MAEHVGSEHAVCVLVPLRNLQPSRT